MQQHGICPNSDCTRISEYEELSVGIPFYPEQ